MKKEEKEKRLKRKRRWQLVDAGLKTVIVIGAMLFITGMPSVIDHLLP